MLTKDILVERIPLYFVVRNCAILVNLSEMKRMERRMRGVKDDLGMLLM